jgi:hypothetical protein
MLVPATRVGSWIAGRMIFLARSSLGDFVEILMGRLSPMVFRILYLSVSVLIVVLGALVSITTGFLDEHETFVDGITKASIGFAVLFAGFLNIAVIRSGGDSVICLICF